jgi:hypothetical protein
MAKRNYREIQSEYLRRSRFSRTGKRPFREYHTPEPIAEKLARLSKPDANGCHIWIGKISKRSGYGQINYRENGRRFHRNAHTAAYELKNGPVPPGKEVSHVCPNGPNQRCVNPDHLIAETHAENMARRSWKPKRWSFDCPHCGQPKELVPSVNRNGEWACKPCRAKRAKEWRERTGYDFSAYAAANRERINAQRRARRSKKKRSKINAFQ